MAMPVKLARTIEPPLAYLVIARWANGTPSKIVLTQLESDKETRVGSWKGDDHALDNFRDLARAVGSWDWSLPTPWAGSSTSCWCWPSLFS